MRGLLGIAPDDVPSPKRRQSVLDLPIFDANQNKGLLN
jgi:hypothetical protein